MSLTDILHGHGRHRAVDKVRKLEAENTDLTCKLIACAGQVDQLQGQLDTAGIELSGARSDLEDAVAEIGRLQQQHIDDAVRMDRLRRELHNARPRITAVAARAEEPLSPAGVLPLPVPSQQKEVA